MENEANAIILPRTEDLVALFVWFVPVIFLLLWDVWKAWKRRAFWIPGQAFVLSALIIQLLSFIDYSHISVYSGSRYIQVAGTKEVVAILVKNELVIDSGRLMMCVLIAYLLPGMARSGFITVRSDLTALVLSITFHVVSEPRSVWKVEKRNESLSALAALSEVFDGKISNFASTFLIVAIIYLLLLLIRATMIGRSIRRIMSQKIPSVLSCCTPCIETKDHVSQKIPSALSCCTPCIETKDHVLKCWIVARLSQPDYVLVRSGLCSMVSPTVTACIGVHIIKWRYVQFTDNESLNSVTKRTLVQFVIVLIGWIVLIVRGVTSDMQGNIFSGYHVYGMSMEDAQTDLKAYFIRLFVRDKRIREKRIRALNKKIRDIHSLFWNPPHWLTSTKQMLSHIKTRVIAYVTSIAVVDNGQFSKYRETLEMLLIPGESALSLWVVNQWGFRKVERYMEQGQEDGKRSPRELICLLGLETGTAEGEAGEFASLQQANKNSWKRTAVSLIHFMIYYYDGSADSVIEDASVIEKAMQCYVQGWEYMNFVDGLNEEVKSLGRQADIEFESLQHSWKKRAHRGMLDTEIKQPLGKLIDQLKSCSDEERRNLQNSRDSTEVANDCLCETWKIIDPYLSAPEINKIHRLQRVLANVYFFYMTEGLKEAVLQKCSKLAEEGREEEILDVAFLAAKAQGLLDEVGEGNEPEDQVEPRHNTDQASTSSTIPTVNEQFDVKKNNNSGRWSTKSSNSGRWSTKSSNSGRWSTVTVGNNVKGSDVKRNNNVKSNNFVSGVVGEGNLANNTVGNNTAVGHSAMGRNFVGNNSVFGDGQAKRRSTNSNNSNNAEIVMIGKGSVDHNSVGSVGNNSPFAPYQTKASQRTNITPMRPPP